mgnify:CR=1 FL=1
MLLAITWDISPVIFSIGSISIRWYGLLWAIGFLVGLKLVEKMFKHENIKEEWLDSLFIYVAVGSILGARIGHCLFYEWEYYSKNILEIFMIWQGGLASHGGAIGILIAIYLYNKRISKKGFIWVLDRLVIAVAFAGACIRLGNLMNSEIYGTPTNLPWGFIFVQDGQTIPMHPTQIYEMLYCLITFAVCYWMYWKKNLYEKRGYIFGVFLIGIFLSRFLLEFIKNNQETFEDYMLLNMGQILSIPFIIWGFYLIYQAKYKYKIKNH